MTLRTARVDAVTHKVEECLPHWFWSHRMCHLLGEIRLVEGLHAGWNETILPRNP